MTIFIDLVYRFHTLMQLTFLHSYHFDFVLGWLDVFALSFHFSLCSFVFQLPNAVVTYLDLFLRLDFGVRGLFLLIYGVVVLIRMLLLPKLADYVLSPLFGFLHHP